MVATFPTAIPIGGCIGGDLLHENLAMGSLALKCDASAPDGVGYDVFMGSECAGDPLLPALVANMADIEYTVSGVECGGQECPYAVLSSVEGCPSTAGGMKDIYFYLTNICEADVIRQCANGVITAQPCAGGDSTTTAAGCNDGKTETVTCIDPTATAAPVPEANAEDSESSTGSFRGLLTVTLMALSVAAIAMI